jgi:predicted amino acid racemase
VNRLVIDLNALQQNIQVIDTWMHGHGASWSLVTKALCGHRDTLGALQALGVRSIADSRIENLRMIEKVIPEFESWYLRLPSLSDIAEIVELSDVSLNSEIRIIQALDEAARAVDKKHRVIVMIELGDLREGILPGTLVDFYRQVFRLENIEVFGIGANLGCLAGTIPNVDQLMQLVLYKQLLELKFERALPMISAGSSSVLPLLLEGRVPKAVNHFRIGEAVLLGTNLVTGDLLDGLNNDVFTLEAEIVEIKEKGLIPLGETTSMTPFERLEDEGYSPGQRGFRAILSVGQLDTDCGNLTPRDPNFRIAGASSDVMVVNLGDNDQQLAIGDSIRFGLGYSALVRLMSGKYVEKVVTPGLPSFEDSITPAEEIEVPPVVQE